MHTKSCNVCAIYVHPLLQLVVYTQYIGWCRRLYCESYASAAVSPGLPQGDLQLLPVHPMLHQVLAVEVEHRNVKLIQPSPFLVACHVYAALYQCYLHVYHACHHKVYIDNWNTTSVRCVECIYTSKGSKCHLQFCCNSLCVRVYVYNYVNVHVCMCI